MVGKYMGNVGGTKTKLSKYLDASQQPLEVVKITIPTVLRLKMKKGSTKANDNEGNIRVVTDGICAGTYPGEIIGYNSSKTKRNYSKMEYTDMNFDKKNLLKIKITPIEIQKNAIIDFFADDDDWVFSTVSNVHCGRIAVINTSKVGKRLTENIEGLPIATDSQQLPHATDEERYNYTYGHPEEAFAIANKYQNCLGMCFAITMARVKKAFQDEWNLDLLTLLRTHQDYIYSGTITLNIPEKYFGYGVGGLLASKVYADLLTNKEVWAGKLEEGAILQYWANQKKVSWEDIKKDMKYKLKNYEYPPDTKFTYGHSVIFKCYLFDENDTIYGMRYYDSHGTDEGLQFLLTDEEQKGRNVAKIFFGANLKDKI
ncbi:hypothetical protein HNQ02_003853 [Flavobacterium sp. 7E]|nr:hypothetical protein [Flavobacterium sp. 7E]